MEGVAMLRRSLLPLCLLYTMLVLATSCGTRPSGPTESSTSAIAQSGTTPTADTAAVDARLLAAIYRERLRLGLGSPYRLIETALRDDRLGETRAAVARALLDQIENGAMYEVSPLALTATGIPEPSAIAQFELVRQAVESTSDPRVGELAVQLGYELAAAEHTVTPELVARVARVAALLRDRQLAARDVRRLRDAARHLAVAPQNLVLTWRSQRAFAVEQPTLMPLDPAAQDEAARLALLLVGGIRSAVAPVASTLQRTLATAPRVSADLAAALAQDSAERLPQNAVVITLRAIRSGAQESRNRVSAPHWQAFFDRASDEELFVTELATARRSAADDVVAAGITLDVATALRPFAQEPIGSSVASAQDLTTRFGVRVRFDPRVTDAERARSLHMLTRSLEDLRAVIRTIDLAGLTFHIGPLDATAPHLAYHEPRKRVIHLDPATTAGTLAHEVAHDLDWQLAARKYRTRSNYATDYATRNHRTLAYAVRNLTGATAPMNKPAPDDPGARRPAEIFARRFEWYVASALAQRGLSNGYLSSAQNDWIAGYGAAVRPDPTARAAISFAAILADATKMDRVETSAVERTITESTPVAVRVLARAGSSTDRATFDRQSLTDLAEWECAGAWRPRGAAGTAMRWFVRALGEAAFQPGVVALAPAVAPATDSPLQPRGDMLAAVRPIGTRGGSCATLIGAVLAPL
jgi:hypothetical protein